MNADERKLVGPNENMTTGWQLISSGLELDTSQPLKLYLGCTHEKKVVLVLGIGVSVMA